MSGISTQVQDVVKGSGAAGVPVVLEHEAVAGRWRVVANTKTDDDGRVKDLAAPGSKLAPGTYRLRVESGAYFKHLKMEHLHPRVEVIFAVADARRRYHIMVLVGPFGYTTYLGT